MNYIALRDLTMEKFFNLFLMDRKFLKKGSILYHAMI